MKPPVAKRRKTGHSVLEIKFDPAAREEYLTGFHKRKQQRIKQAQEAATKREREDRIRDRKQRREQRKREVEEHVQAVDAVMRASVYTTSREDGEGWDGTAEEPTVEAEEDKQGEANGSDDSDDENREDEYIDDDLRTTVTVEAIDISRTGPPSPPRDVHPEDVESQDKAPKKKPRHIKVKTKKKKFRYETKAERKETRFKSRVRNKAKAKERRG